MNPFLFLIISIFPSFVLATSFQGVWTQDCQSNDDDVFQVSLDVKNNLWTWKGIGYDKDLCHEPYLIYEETYSLEKIESLTDFDSLINLKTEEISYTPLSDEVAEALNLINFCGRTDWASGRKTNITGQICEDRPLRKQGDLYFQKVGMTGNQIFWGLLSQKENGTSPDRRPHQYESLPFQKTQGIQNE